MFFKLPALHPEYLTREAMIVMYKNNSSYFKHLHFRTISEFFTFMQFKLHKIPCFKFSMSILQNKIFFFNFVKIHFFLNLNTQWCHSVNPIKIGSDSNKCNWMSTLTRATSIANNSNQCMNTTLNDCRWTSTIAITCRTISSWYTDVTSWVEIVIERIVDINTILIGDNWQLNKLKSSRKTLSCFKNEKKKLSKTCDTNWLAGGWNLKKYHEVFKGVSYSQKDSFLKILH